MKDNITKITKIWAHPHPKPVSQMREALANRDAGFGCETGATLLSPVGVLYS